MHVHNIYVRMYDMNHVKVLKRPLTTSEAFDFVSSRVATSSELSSMLPVEVASSRKRVSSKDLSKRLFSLYISRESYCNNYYKALYTCMYYIHIYVCICTYMYIII